MNILILVLSYEKHPYNGFMQAQQETWDSIKIPEVKTFYYTGGLPENEIGDFHYNVTNGLMKFKAPDDYYWMHWKFKLCLDAIKKMCIPFDFIFRTNSCGYVNKNKLLKFCEILPKEKCYAGWSLGEKEAVSGAGIFLSPDMVEILREELPYGENVEEDILIGRILHKKHGIEIFDNKTRIDVWDDLNVPLDRYHYRFKTHDRLQDIRNIYQLHKIINHAK